MSTRMSLCAPYQSDQWLQLPIRFPRSQTQTSTGTVVLADRNTGYYDVDSALECIFLSRHSGRRLFVLAIRYSPALREGIRSNGKALVIPTLYGMGIWMFMSLMFIPAMVLRPPMITTKWWVQLFGHIPFVVGPMILVDPRQTGHLELLELYQLHATVVRATYSCRVVADSL